jgi:hypothetical protein
MHENAVRSVLPHAMVRIAPVLLTRVNLVVSAGEHKRRATATTAIFSVGERDVVLVFGIFDDLAAGRVHYGGPPPRTLLPSA